MSEEMVPRQWEGETALLVASGPSLRKEDVDACRGKMRVLVINDNWKIAPWADALYACDGRWWNYYKGVPEFQGQKWTIDRIAKGKYPELHRVEGKKDAGLSLDPRFIHTGRNGGYQALNLAILFGASRILLTGYDMQATGGKKHWFGNHPQELVNTSDYNNFCAAYKTLKSDLQRCGHPVINCTRETALTCFLRMDIGEAIERYGHNASSQHSQTSGILEVSASL